MHREWEGVVKGVCRRGVEGKGVSWIFVFHSSLFFLRYDGRVSFVEESEARMD